VLGETGAGKTTLVRMLLALLRPQGGRVEIYDATRSRELSPRMRCNFVYVPQGNTLMSGTIRDNLRLGRLDATDDDMLAALHQSCADFVLDLPDGLNTVCSEAGGGLSEGQAQRIAIARALLRNRSIMVFDEATSALDPDTERQLLHNLLAKHDKTVIFITHRLAVVEYCDQTLHIEKR
jgi:ABC-type multidrug transport system fused ATPase/permease subunit